MPPPERPRALCAGCVHFRVVGGRFPYTCMMWGVSSARYDIARLIFESTGEPCPYCEPARPAGRRPRDGKPDNPDGLLDLRV